MGVSSILGALSLLGFLLFLGGIAEHAPDLLQLAREAFEAVVVYGALGGIDASDGWFSELARRRGAAA